MFMYSVIMMLSVNSTREDTRMLDYAYYISQGATRVYNVKKVSRNLGSQDLRNAIEPSSKKSSSGKEKPQS